MKAFAFLALSLFLARPGTANQISGPMHITVGSNPRGLAAADLDGDGRAEIIVANFGAPTLIGQTTTGAPNPSIQIFKNYLLTQTLASGHSPRSLTVADINNDGLPDILASFYDDDAIGVYLQKSDHSFASYVAVPAGSHPVGLTAAKVDGSWIVAVANYGSNTVSLYNVDAQGVLSPAGTAAVGANPTDVLIFLPGSSMSPQLIVANYGANSLSFLNLGAHAAVSGRRDMPLEGSPCRLAVGDLNGNGQEDLVVALFAENKVAVYPESEGSFSGTPEMVPLAGIHPNGLTIAHVAGKARPFIVTADRDSDQLDLVGFGSDGILKVMGSQSVKQGDNPQYGPVEVVAGDFTGSGLLDFACTQMRTGLVNVFTQAPPAPPTVSSPTHPDPTRYYPQNRAQFSWNPGTDFNGIDHYQVAFDQEDSPMPNSNIQNTNAPVAAYDNLQPGTYYLHVRAVDNAGDIGSSAVFKIGVTAPMNSDNTYNFPNPSTTGSTTIRFPLSVPQAVQIRIYDEFSALVWSKDLNSSQTIAGVNYVVWNGQNDRGMTVGNGGYILQVRSGGTLVTKKIAIVR